MRRKKEKNGISLCKYGHIIRNLLAGQKSSSSLLWREQTAADLVMATHDGVLATAAKASGLRVIGV